MIVPTFHPTTFNALNAEYIKAQVKHNGLTPASPDMTNEQRLVVLVEEVGEVARAMTYDESSHDKLVKELIQVATMTCDWIEGIDQ